MRSPHARPTLAALAGLSLLLCPASASAYEVVHLEEPEREHVMSVGFGALWFVEDELQPVGGATPAWNIRYTWEATRMIGVSLSWFGNTSIDRTREQLRLANLFEYDVKLALAPMLPIVPFVAAGLGYGAWVGTPEQTDLVTMTVPMAAGVELRGESFVVTARGTYRQVFFDRTAYTSHGADHVALTIELGNRF